MAKRAKRGSLDGSLSHLLTLALQRALELYTEQAGDTGLTQRQYTLLAAVAENEGVTQAELGRATGVDRSTLAEVVARMAAKGMIEREKSPDDARANVITMTRKGWAALTVASPAADAVDEALLKLVPKGTRREFMAGLRGIAGLADDKAPKKKGDRAA